MTQPILFSTSETTQAAGEDKVSTKPPWGEEVEAPVAPKTEGGNAHVEVLAFMVTDCNRIAGLVKKVYLTRTYYDLLEQYQDLARGLVLARRDLVEDVLKRVETEIGLVEKRMLAVGEASYKINFQNQALETRFGQDADRLIRLWDQEWILKRALLTFPLRSQ